MKWVWIVLGVLVGAVALMAVIGALLPKGHVAARSATFRRGADEVFAAIRGFAAYPEWRKDVAQVELLPAAGGKERFREHASYGVITYEVAEEDPPRRLVVRIADDSLAFGGSWTYEVAPGPDGTRLTITEDGEVYNVLFRFLSKVVFSQHATIDQFLGALGRKFGETVTPVAAG